MEARMAGKARRFKVPMYHSDRPGELKSDARILVAGVQWGAGFMVGAIARDGMARKICKGPMVRGPWAFAFGVAAVIDTRGGTARELEEAKKAGLLIEAALGDELEINKGVYRIGRAPNDNIALELVEDLERPRFTFDGKGINGPDEYRSRVATFSEYGAAYAPEIIDALKKAGLA
jgi:hypothetical protein